MKSIRTVACLSCVVVATPAVAAAQVRDTTVITPVVTTATRVGVDERRLPEAVTVITGEHLRTLGITSVADALLGTPSVYVAQSGSFGGQTSIFMRGGESKYVKVLIDGVPVNDPGGAFDFGSLTTDNIERIEIVRGPSSVLYGPDAVTGVIQIFTRGGDTSSHTVFDARAGAYHSADVDGSVRGGVGAAAGYSFSAARHQTDGIYDFNNRFTENVVSGRAQFDPDASNSFALSLRYTDSRYHYPTDGGGTPVDHNVFNAGDRTVLGAKYAHAVRPGIGFVVALASSETNGGTNDQPDTTVGGTTSVSIDDVRRRSADVYVNIQDAGGRGVLTVGVQAEAQDESSQTQALFGTFPFNSQFTAARRNRAGYAQALWRGTPRLTVVVGARADDNQQFGTFGTYRAGVNWSPVLDTRIRVSAGTAFREPTFFENYATGFTVGNPKLEPERAASWEAAIVQPLFGDQLSVSITAFSQRFQNMIDYTGGMTACGFSYCNVARADAGGQEYEAHAQIGPVVSAALGFTHLDTRVVTAGFDTTSGGLYHAGQRLIRRPPTSWNATLASAVPDIGALDMRATYVGDRDDRDFRPFPAVPVVLRSYMRLDVGGRYELARSAGTSAALTLRVENLTDADYQSVFNFRSPRRTILGGMSVAF